MTKQPAVRVFRYLLRRWFTKHQRDLPWRRRQDEYAVLVSEIMLQQTQVSRVAPSFEHFLQLFPSFQILAKASQADVVRAWKGLGYNRRARALHRAAQQVVKEYGGRLPSDDAQLRTLPGVGVYTAQAIRVFVFNESVVAIDTNAQRILARYFFNNDVLTHAQTHAISFELEAANVGGRSDAAAFMDFGAAMCTSRSPQCSVCPFRETCRSSRRFLKGGAVSKIRRSSVPFHSTNRFLRGRIIDTLRDHSQDFFALEQQLCIVRPDLQRKDFQRYMRDLEADGLVRSTKNGSKTRYFLA